MSVTISDHDRGNTPMSGRQNDSRLSDTRTVSRIKTKYKESKKMITLYRADKKKKQADRAKKTYFAMGGNRMDMENMLVMRMYELNVYQEAPEGTMNPPE